MVSRFVSSAASPYRYQSVRLLGVDAVEEFTRVVMRLPTDRRRVRNLFLFDRRSDWSAGTTNDSLAATYRKLILLIGPQLEAFTCVIFGSVAAGLLVHTLTHPLPLLTSLTLRLDVSQLRPFQYAALHPQMPKLRHLTYAIVNHARDCLHLPTLLISECPSVTDVDLAEVSYLSSTILFAVITGRYSAPPAPLARGALPSYKITTSSMMQELAADSIYDAFRPGRGVQVRMEGKLDLRASSHLEGPDENVVGFPDAADYAIYRENPRSAQEWIDAWTADSGRLF